MISWQDSPCTSDMNTYDDALIDVFFYNIIHLPSDLNVSSRSSFIANHGGKVCVNI